MDFQTIQSDPEFVKLPDQAKAHVISELSASDPSFAEQVKTFVNGPALANGIDVKATGSGQPSPKPRALRPPEPIGPYEADRLKRGVAALPIMLARALDSASPTKTPSISKLVEKLATIKNLPTPKNEYGNENKSAETLGTVLEFLGGSVIPSVGIVGAAERPLVQAMVETLGAVGGGLTSEFGKTAGREWAIQHGDDPDRAERIGEFLGGIFGSVALGASAAGGRRGVSKLQEKFPELRGKDTATFSSDEINQSLSAYGPAEQNLREAHALQQANKDFTPTLGQATGAPGVIGLESNLAGSNAEELAKATAMGLSTAKAIVAERNKAFPPSTLTVAEHAREQVKTSSAALQRQSAALDLAENDLVSRYPYGSSAEAGAKLRDIRNARMIVVRKQKNAMYDDVYKAADAANDGKGLKSDVADVSALITDVMGSDENAAKIMPSLFPRVQKAIKARNPDVGLSGRIVSAVTGQPLLQASVAEAGVSLQALHSMLKEARHDLAAAISRNDGTANNIYAIKGALQKKMDAFKGSQYGDVAEKLGKADSFWLNNYKRVFKEGAGERIVNLNSVDRMTPEEKVVGEFFKPGTKEGMQDFASLYVESSEARGYLERGIKDIFARQVLVDGEISPARVAAFFKKYSQSLEMVPNLKKEFSSVEEATNGFVSRRAEINSQQKALNQSIVAKLAKSPDPHPVLDKALAHPDNMRQLLSMAKDPDVRQAVSGALAERVMSYHDPYKYISSNEKLLKPALDQLGSGHFDNLKKIAKMQEIANRVPVPTSLKVPTLEEFGKKAVGTGLSSVAAMFKSVAEGRVGDVFYITYLGGRKYLQMKNAEVKALLSEAIFNPDLADALAKLGTSPTQSSFKKFMTAGMKSGIRIGGRAVVAGEVATAPSEEAP